MLDVSFISYLNFYSSVFGQFFYRIIEARPWCVLNRLVSAPLDSVGAGVVPKLLFLGVASRTKRHFVLSKLESDRASPLLGLSCEFILISLRFIGSLGRTLLSAADLTLPCEVNRKPLTVNLLCTELLYIVERLILAPFRGLRRCDRLIIRIDSTEHCLGPFTLR